jgi:hypothetical protein
MRTQIAEAKRMLLKKRLIRVLGTALLCLGLCCAVTAQTLPVSCPQFIRSAEAGSVTGAQVERAFEVLHDLLTDNTLQTKLQLSDYVKVCNDVSGVSDSFVGGSDGPVTPADLVKITLNQSVNFDELVASLNSLANYLRNPADGSSLFGVVLKTGQSDGSRRLIKTMATGNRGFFFEAAGTRSIITHNVQIQGQPVSPANLVGAGVKAMLPNYADPMNNGQLTNTSVEGDLVINNVGGFADFIDFKANGGNFTEDELNRVFQAIVTNATGQLRGSQVQVRSFTFVVENTVNLNTVTCSDGTRKKFIDVLDNLISQLPASQQGRLDVVQTSFL